MYTFKDNIERQIKFCDGMVLAYQSVNKEKYWYYSGMVAGFIEISGKPPKVYFEDRYKCGILYLKGYNEAYKIALNYARSIMYHIDTGVRDNY